MLTSGTRVPKTTKRTSVRAISLRKSPKQSRSGETVAVIVEAAARVLELKGFEGFNTNAVAEKAGVSIGSLYQYFSGKDALLTALIEREVIPLLTVRNELKTIRECRAAMRSFLRACFRHQMKRPQLARLIDIAEKRELFSNQVVGIASRLQAVMEAILHMHDAPPVSDRHIAAADVLALTRALIDLAGERGESESEELLARVEGAVWGYLCSNLLNQHL